MASFIARRSFSTTLRRLTEDQSKKALRQEERRNPEIYIMGGVVACAVAGAAFYFGSSPTKSTSESQIAKAGAPWETNGSGAYRYYPGGDRKNEPKDAPSAVNVVVVPEVTVSKELHERFNKWGKEGYP
ncbi:hypothetical protein SODALDRAFT_108239 [Sodiomyces alkalinus F11]|uniref:Uncharacterized protein n=1 Tax=Sodiomyces alkalinus (strain CBS 110278 / VKM F-3762 / F11) TaxID=1314773 RepID=A0A3N2Q2T7_SODAK|nr:hypothetical protein SODALDRAFT_108239 [Sodiomyces alkalinus F11]ROT40935.1 hypothetical protein SODALDRAFT_108239 [Sodiomyces alkalinus F11]